MSKVTKFGSTYQVKYWDGIWLGNTLAVDTETSLITSPAIIPDLVLTTVYNGSNSIYVVKNQDVVKFFQIHSMATLYMWNASFDVPVLESNGVNFDLYISLERLLDGQLLYRLHEIATIGQEAKKWSLDYATELYLKEVLDKDEEIRLTFGNYLNTDKVVDYEQIPEKHLIYAALDAVATFKVSEKILTQITALPTKTNLAHKIHLMGDLALAQVTRNGIRIDRSRVARIKQELEDEKIKNERILSNYGYTKGKKGNTKILDEYFESRGFKLPETATGKINKSKSNLEQYRDDEFVNAYLSFKGFDKQESFLTRLNVDVVYPKYLTIKVTSRVSCINPNITQLPRIGGIRECFVPQKDHVFVIIDYSMIELVALSSITLGLFGYSKMAEIINAGKDLHKYMASKINNCPEEDVTKEQRQFAKVANFGFGANMGIETFQNHAKKAGYILTIEQAKQVKNAYLVAYPEMIEYFNRGMGRTQVVTDTGFVRGNCSYTEVLNCAFQTKVAEGAKLSLYALMKKGLKIVMFVHDELVFECHKDEANKTLGIASETMIACMGMVIKGVNISVDGKIHDRYTK